VNTEAPSATGSLIFGSEIFSLLGLLTVVGVVVVAMELARLGRQVSARVMIAIPVAVPSILGILPATRLPNAGSLARHGLPRRPVNYGTKVCDAAGRLAT
jgi:hypothetical protein